MTQYLARPEGRIAYDVEGSGPLVVLVPGMGDLRSTYRHLVPALLEAGLRVASTDLRGHGDSDPTFASYGDVETADDVAALVEHLGGGPGAPAVLVGSSMGAGAAAYVAAVRPELVAGLVLLGPFVRNAPLSALQRLGMRLALARPWVVTSWRAYVPKLYAGRRPVDLDEHLDAIATSMRRPRYAGAFASLVRRLDHAPVEARLGEVTAPALVVMGELDPDFDDPAAEAAWVAEQLRGEVLMAPEAGHYPHAQRPDLVAPAVVRFARTAHAGA